MAGTLRDIDLSACAAEPIHIPGSVQPHGALLAVDDAGTVLRASESALAHLGAEAAALLGRPLGEALGPEAGAEVLGWLPQLGEGGPGRFLRCDSVGAERPGRAPPRPAWVSARRWRGAVLVEVEPDDAPGAPEAPAPSPAPNLERALASFRDVAASEANLFRLCQRAAEAMAVLVGHDRVMVYRFHPDWSGEVVAETRARGMTPFLGLRYPASDIPEQARRLYLEARVRVVADVRAVPSPILPRLDPATGAPLDIGLAGLRPMSPTHVEYLSNMGVAASLTVSVAVDGALWGLVACHHRTRRAVPPRLREAAARLGEILAARIGALAAARAADAERHAARALGCLEGRLSAVPNPARALLLGRHGLPGAVFAGGAALLVAGPDGEDAVLSTGAVPDAAWLRRLAGAIAARDADAFASEDIGRDLPALAPPPAEACGVLAAVVSREPLAVAACLRGELVHEVQWGGDPDKPAEVDPVTHRLSPRKSFELWSQEVRGTAGPWTARDRALMAGVPGLLGGREGMVAALRRGIEELARDERSRGLGDEVIDAVPEGIVMVAAVGAGDALSVDTANRAFLDAFELDEEPLPPDFEDFRRRIGLPDLRAPGPDGKPLECELWSRRRGRRVMRVTRRDVLDAQAGRRRSRLALFAFTDVTEFRQSEDILRAARDRAEAAEHAKSAFLANMSHELWTPLNAVIGFSELMTSGLFGPLGHARYEEYAHDVLSAGRHLLSLINDVLELARIDAAGADLPGGEPVDLCEVMARALGMLRPQADAGGVDLGDVVIAGEADGSASVWVHADPRAMLQIALNLLSNAVKFTPPGGEVRPRVGRSADGACWMAVEDTGIGIPEAELDHVFEPFVRIGNVMTQSTGGTGLGLTLVKSLAEAHGGIVALNSGQGLGTAVRVTLPPWRALDSGLSAPGV